MMLGTRWMSLSIALGVAVVATGATWQEPKQDTTDKADKTRTVRASGLRFDVPNEWTQVKPKNEMRKAQIVIEPVEGDKTGAELVLTAFPGGAGGVDANVDRWCRQFTDASGQSPEADIKKVKGENTEVTRVELSGTFTDPFSGGSAQPAQRLLGAIVMTDDYGYFLKLIGPEKTVANARPAFDRMLNSIGVEASPR